MAVPCKRSSVTHTLAEGRVTNTLPGSAPFVCMSTGSPAIPDIKETPADLSFHKFTRVVILRSRHRREGGEKQEIDHVNNFYILERIFFFFPHAV